MLASLASIQYIVLWQAEDACDTNNDVAFGLPLNERNGTLSREFRAAVAVRAIAADREPQFSREEKSIRPHRIWLAVLCTGVVTGAARGLGKAAAVGLAVYGSDVAAIDVDYDRCTATVSEIAGLGRRAIAYGCDLADQDTVRDTVQSRRTVAYHQDDSAAVLNPSIFRDFLLPALRIGRGRLT